MLPPSIIIPPLPPLHFVTPYRAKITNTLSPSLSFDRVHRFAECSERISHVAAKRVGEATPGIRKGRQSLQAISPFFPNFSIFSFRFTYWFPPVSSSDSVRADSRPWRNYYEHFFRLIPLEIHAKRVSTPRTKRTDYEPVPDSVEQIETKMKITWTWSSQQTRYGSLCRSGTTVNEIPVTNAVNSSNRVPALWILFRGLLCAENCRSVCRNRPLWQILGSNDAFGINARRKR